MNVPDLLIGNVETMSGFPSRKLGHNVRLVIIIGHSKFARKGEFRMFSIPTEEQPGILIKEHSHKSYRPLTVLSFRLNYAVHGLEPMGYHFINIVLHAFVCHLFYK
ncbi:transmembrane and TPR repeat-containing protein 3 [Trichonephila clavipes]|nr:transmembrane and TPR repeat-containing protein 3 [Trichonephila clavipes]